MAFLMFSAFYLMLGFYLQGNINKLVPAPVSQTMTSEVTQSSSGLPTQLIIPTINVNAQIISLGLASDGSVDVPKGPHQTSWFNLGPKPGEKGSAVISGHYGIWKNGTDSVFNLLPNLKIGDNIYVKDEKGITHSFVVEKTKIYGKNEIVPEIFNKNDDAYLNIITCNGTWLANEKTYSQRLVVFAKEQ